MNERTFSNFDYEDESIKFFKENRIAVIHIKANVFSNLVDLGESGKLFRLFELVEEDNEIASVFLYNSPDCLSEKQYDIFFKKICTPNDSKWENTSSEKIYNGISRAREINILNKFIFNISNSRKLFIVGLQGNIATPFFGASLAADIRFGSPDLVFSFPHIKHKAHPGGALPFFLTEYLNPGTAAEIMFKGENLHSDKAISLGLINKIIEKDGFKENCIKEINTNYKLDQCCITKTKVYLKRHSRKELKDYQEFESSIHS